MKKLLAVLAAFVLAFSFGVFADNHEEETIDVEVTSETEVTEEEAETEGEVEAQVILEDGEEFPEDAEVVITSESTVRVEGWLVAVELQAAIDYLYENGLTMFGTEATFMGEQSLRRDEAAAFFARFARDVLGMELDADVSCEFSDLATAHQDLLGEIEAACQLGLMRGHDGNFMPTDTFSNAHAMTVLVRLLVGEQEEPEGNWAATYASVAQEAGLTASLAADSEANLYAPISRADVAKMIEGSDAFLKIEGIKNEDTSLGEDEDNNEESSEEEAEEDASEDEEDREETTEEEDREETEEE